MQRPPKIDWPKATMTPATMALEVPVIGPSPEWRAAFKRLAAERNLRVQPADWLDILLVANRIVVVGIAGGAEERVRDELDRIGELAWSAARTQRKLAGLIKRG